MTQSSSSTEYITIFVRLIGITLLLVGLFIGIKVILEAWSLYEEPQRIEPFSVAIEQGSNLDAMIHSFSSQIPTKTEPRSLEQPHDKSSQQVRLSYFMAWGIVIFLLMVIGSLAASAIRTGGQLALYDLQVKQFAQQLINEARKQK
jgi:disulfide bond formation protein DsbB